MPLDRLPSQRLRGLISGLESPRGQAEQSAVTVGETAAARGVGLHQISVGQTREHFMVLKIVVHFQLC